MAFDWAAGSRDLREFGKDARVSHRLDAAGHQGGGGGRLRVIADAEIFNSDAFNRRFWQAGDGSRGEADIRGDDAAKRDIAAHPTLPSPPFPRL